MKTLFLALLLSSCAAAQSGLSFYIDPSDGSLPTSSLSALPTAYAFPSTSVGQTASIMIRMVNSSSATLQVNGIYVGAAAGSSSADNNFSVTGFADATLAPGGMKPFYLNFTPNATGPLSGFLQVTIAGQNPAAISTLSGTGLSSSVNLTCTDTLFAGCNGTTPLAANSAITFGSTGGVAVGSTYSIAFSLTNNTSAAIATPNISTQVYAVASFTSPGLAALPATIAAGATVSFTVIFTPQASASGPSTPQTATLTVGSASYTLQGYEQIVSGNDPIQVTCVYSSGQPCQGSANTYTVGPVTNTLTLVFQVTNPNPLGTVDANITLSAPPVLSNTAAFGLSTPTLAPTNSTSGGTAVTAGQPVAILPGYTLSFQVTFTGSAATSATLGFAYTPAGATTATPLSYTLNATPAPAVGSAGSDLPGVALICGTTSCGSQTFTSQQQVQATLQVTTATTAAATLAIAFTPLVSGAKDSAVEFIAPYTQNDLSFSFTSASLSGMLGNSQPQFTFQTGTTAGTINFTLTDSATLQTLNLPAITILPEKVQITSSTAVQSSPNLVLTITGYDNTYSAGELAFSFYGTNGALLNPTPISLNAASAFEQYFFSSTNTSGGAFSLSVTFPVTGDVTEVGSVTATVTNSAGQASVSQSFTASTTP